MFKMKPEVFDKINAVSEQFGGLAALQMYEDDGKTPRCMVGAAHFAGVIQAPFAIDNEEPLYDAASSASDAGLLPDYTKFDMAHGNLTSDSAERLPWPVVAAKMGVVRGDA